jgi:hypothetical protein
MNGIVLGMMMLVSSAGAVPAPDTPVGPAASAATRWDDADPPLKLPRVLVDEPRPAAWRLDPPRSAQTTAAANGSSTAAKIIGTAIGAFGGFYAGGMIGFYTAQDRNADDDGVSGLQGVVIGAPIGAVVGAVIGYRVAK